MPSGLRIRKRTPLAGDQEYVMADSAHFVAIMKRAFGRALPIVRRKYSRRGSKPGNSMTTGHSNAILNRNERGASQGTAKS
jgi:hypothetical protein